MQEETGRASFVLGALGRIADVEHGRVEDVLAMITETAAQTLDIARVNIWLYNAERTQIECIEAYDRASNRHERGATLAAAKYPSYFSALDCLRNVTAMDVATDPRTQELLDNYLIPNRIGSMLDVPLLRSGHVIGVVCHEHVGAPRAFFQWERFFAGSIGDLVSLALETERRVLVERERTKLVEQLARAKRVEGLGFLAAGVAHDVRNLLQIVTGSADVLGRDASGAAKIAVEDIGEAVRRAKELCDSLLTYAGHSERRKTPVSVGTLVTETERLLRSRIPPGVKLEVDLSAKAPDVLGDSTSIRQVLVNLVINAFDALAARGGTIRVRVAPGEPPNDHVFDFREGSRPSLMLEVEDDGPGMSPETQARIFDPFFTTKADGHGFGLAAVLGITRSHAGALAVESELGRGTALRVWLPLAGA
jgi:signal transduction histidine kinase